MTLTGSDLELFERSLAHAVAADDVDAALADLGWAEALAEDRRAAVALLFELQGRAGATSSALDLVPGLDHQRLALAHELVGTSRAMLELARVHATERVQFDRPIAQFQAVRHKLAETLVAIEGANDACAAAWELDVDPMAAAAAKALAGRAARLAAKHCQQVLAGIGFTLEHPFHRYLRRALVLDRQLGDSKTLTRELGETLLRDRQVPPMLAL